MSCLTAPVVIPDSTVLFARSYQAEIVKHRDVRKAVEMYTPEIIDNGDRQRKFADKQI